MHFSMAAESAYLQALMSRHQTRISERGMRTITAISALLIFGSTGSVLSAQDEAPPRTASRAPKQVVKMDSARAAMLYVSNRPEDHPQEDFAAQLASKARTDSIYAAQSRGSMEFRKISYKSADGLMIPAYLFSPPGTHEARSLPALVWVHGGVHGNWDELMLPFVKDAVARGYVVITPEYRGSGGFGKDFYNAIDYGGKEVDDVLGAVDPLRNLPYVNPERIGLMGWSHGAYIAALLMFRGKTPFKAGVTIVPVTNLVYRLSLKGPSYQKDFATEAGIRGLPFEKPQEYIKRSPVYSVDGLDIPMMVHFATNDTNVELTEAQLLVDALRARKPLLAEVKVYDNPPPGYTGKGHTFSRRVNTKTLAREDSPEQLDSWARTWAFFDRWLAAKK
jgi:dipeptidyl aminopeptidase/acylaminoacyl peptidase